MSNILAAMHQSTIREMRRGLETKFGSNKVVLYAFVLPERSGDGIAIYEESDNISREEAVAVAMQLATRANEIAERTHGA